MLKENSGNPNKFWKSLKTIYPTKSTTGPSIHSFDIDGVKTDDPARISNAFCTFFATVTSKLRESAIPLRDFVSRNPAATPQRTDKQFKFHPVSKLEVERELRSIKRTKSTGIDNLPPGLLKDAACLISAPLAHLINLSLQTGIFPTDMKIANIVPVHKSGSFSSFDNYRPISVLPVLSKVIEKLVQRQLMEFLDKNKLLSKFQFGFRRRLSKELAATCLLDEIRKSVDQGKLVGATFIDHSKAFDTISHSNLLQKLPQYGIKEGELSWFADYLFHRSAAVSYGKSSSKIADIQTGVSQGSILGPLLFILFFNDITDIIMSTRIVKYADDTVIYVADKNLKNIKTKLSKDMESIADWFDENGLIINLKKGKTESLLFDTSQRIAKQSETLDVMYRGSKILNTKQYKYLGIEIDSTLNLNTHFEKCFQRAPSRLRLLAKMRDSLELTSAKAVYDSMILRTFTYCGVLQLRLTSTQANRLSSFHDRCLKIINGNSKHQFNQLPVPKGPGQVYSCANV